MNSSLDYYKTFYYVAKLGSFTEAAKVLLNNQPNVSKAIQNLEGELGCKLFERSRKGVVLTEEGKVLFERISVVMREIELAEKDIEELKNIERGKVAIATTEIALHGILLPILKEYKMQYPNIQLSVSNQTTREALDTIKRGDADFAVVTGELPNDVEFDIIPIMRFEEIAVCSDFYEELLKGKISYEILSNYTIISLKENSMSYKFYKKVFEDNGIEFAANIITESINQILSMVAYDLGIGFIPQFYFQKFSPYSNIRKIPLEQQIPLREIFLVKRKNHVESIASLRLEELIKCSA